jgi:hypothetical protein
LFRIFDNCFRATTVYPERASHYICTCRRSGSFSASLYGALKQEQIMKRTLATAIGASLVLSLAASASAFAQTASTAPKTRAEVKAELVAAYRDGTLPSLNKTSYPEQGLVGRTQAQRLALQEGRGNDAARVAQAGE